MNLVDKLAIKNAVEYKKLDPDLVIDPVEYNQVVCMQCGCNIAPGKDSRFVYLGQFTICCDCHSFNKTTV